MKTNINRDLQIGFGLSLLLVIIGSIASYLSIHSLLNNAEKVHQNNNVIGKLESIISTMKDAETGQRGFLLSGEEVFLQPYNGSAQKVFGTLKEVDSLTADDAYWQQHINELKSAVLLQLNGLQRLINDKRTGKSISIAQLKQGKDDMDSLRGMVSNMENHEKALLSASAAAQLFLTAFAPIIIVFAAVLTIVISVVYYFKLQKKYDENIKLRQDLEHKEGLMATRLNIIHGIAGQISNGDYQIRVNDKEQDNLGGLSVSLNKMAESLQANESLQKGINSLNDKMLGQKGQAALTTQVLEFLVEYTKSNVGAFYTLEQDVLHLQSGYALAQGHHQEFKVGEGLVGQCAVSKKATHLKNIDKNSIAISYASGGIKPANIIAVPICHEKQVLGVIELASIESYSDLSFHFLDLVVQNIGIALHTVRNHHELQLLLNQTQLQTEELSKRQRELENMNAELEAYTQKLQLSDEELRVQQEELEQSNQVLEERSHLLEERNLMILERNLEIQRKAEELELATQYKTEFMANMSHELRTPLNSILLLSRHLAENNEGNLSSEQIESAQVILGSGNGLLNLIDEILDLSKIEAGKMDADYERITIGEIVSEMQGLFMPVAREKKLTLNISANPVLPDVIETDKPKLEQILKNLLSNALKFTVQGEVSLKIEADDKPDFIRFSVTDSGIGISPKDQELIFEPFRQADGSTRRNYGGTGLGLSISRKIAELLQGEIRLISEPGKGSEFILSIPKEKPNGLITETGEIYAKSIDAQKSSVKEAPVSVNTRIKHVTTLIPAEIKDDRDKLKEGDKLILIIEDDTVFASALLKFTHEKGYKGIVAVRGDLGLEMVHQYKPVAVLLDIQLPVKDGWEVMEELKSNPATRHIPVHVMSSLEVKKESLLKGAVDFINKPFALVQMKTVFEKLEDAIRRSPKKVLIVEDNEQHAKALSYFLQTFNITTEISGSIDKSITTLQKREVDCVIMEMGISGKAIYESLEIITRQPGLDRIPVIVFTGKNLSEAEEGRILRFADSIVVKTAQSYQRVLDEVALFLHVMEGKEPSAVNKLSKKPDALTEVLKNKTILIADDDVRNIFSLTKSLEKYKMNVTTATNGREALEQLEQQHIDIVLMDMMMPEMDGYESLRQIRQHPNFKQLPVIAVTAKVMPADREACIEAGASDYISKPVDVDQLISLLRVWLYDQSL